MALSPGTQLGQFEITGLLGKGGMGEVYRARDTKLGREVAVKVLPEGFAEDAERLERFEREAKMLAALDHANIGALHDFQHVDGVQFLVLQLVEGETLQERIQRDPIPLREALPLFIQIAEALEAAHSARSIPRACVRCRRWSDEKAQTPHPQRQNEGCDQGRAERRS